MYPESGQERQLERGRSVRREFYTFYRNQQIYLAGRSQALACGAVREHDEPYCHRPAERVLKFGRYG
ncbi:hypothetical protein D3C72_2496790 [compost metagenome]